MVSKNSYANLEASIPMRLIRPRFVIQQQEHLVQEVKLEKPSSSCN